ncbi:MAG: hypothetical protein QNJ71_10535 [Acidimicrobiia bacterium]|nr:hypothetical protein [Acidimicrobiia bacterium]
MTGVIVAAVIAFVVVGVVLARNTSSRKKQAIASLEEEKKSIGHFSIVDLIDAEVTELGLRSIDGAEGIPPEVLLKTWSTNESVHDCAHHQLRYVLAPGVEPADADHTSLELICDRSAPLDARQTDTPQADALEAGDAADITPAEGADEPAS